MDERNEPKSIDVDKDSGVTLTYLDGFVASFDLETLRRGCPCATCRTMREQGQEAWPRPGSPKPLKILSAELHGAWGLHVSWNDGHATGIYPFDALRRWGETGQPIRPDSGLGA